MRLNYRQTILLGCAFLGLQVLFAVYNAYVPLFLQSGRTDFADAAVPGGFGLNATITGFIMTLDNLAALVILPYIGALSDATASRWGKRKPYIVLGAPVAALGLALVPLTLGQPLVVFMAAVILMVLAVDFIRTPIIALMPDITPSALRSQANGIINLMGGVGGVLAFVIGGELYKRSVVAPFWFGAAALLLGCAVAVLVVRVPTEAETKGNFLQQMRHAARKGEGNPLRDLAALWRAGDRSTLLLLGSICCLFLAYSALTVFFTSFAAISLRVPRGQESQLLSLFALSIVVLALPAGIAGARLGRKRAMIAGAIVFALTLFVIGQMTDLLLVRALLVIAGAGWSLIVVNALPMVLDCAPHGQEARLGVFTGLYFIATQTAEIVGPLLVGGFLDLTGREYRLMFVYTFVVLFAGVLLMLPVRRGEVIGRVNDKG